MKSEINKNNKRRVLLVAALLALSACIISAMSDGIRNNYGIMLSAIIENSGMSYASVSFVLAIGQLLYGLFQSVFGVLAQKKGSTKTLILGVCLMLAGLLLLPQCRSPFTLTLCLGILLPAGTGATSYRLLMAGFFTCGFHMALISNHLPSQIVSYGISEAAASYVFSIYGILTMAGSVLSGLLCAKLKMKNVLGTYYGMRVVATAAFFALPKTLPVIIGYAVLLGMTGAATVPPVSGLIGKEFGAERVGALYGFVFFIHSLGGFLGAWLGGLFLDAFGGYVQIWAIDILLCAAAAAASYMIKDQMPDKWPQGSSFEQADSSDEP